jgi:hypothetical protein
MQSWLPDPTIQKAAQGFLSRTAAPTGVRRGEFYAITFEFALEMYVKPYTDQEKADADAAAVPADEPASTQNRKFVGVTQMRYRVQPPATRIVPMVGIIPGYYLSAGGAVSVLVPGVGGAEATGGEAAPGGWMVVHCSALEELLPEGIAGGDKKDPVDPSFELMVRAGEEISAWIDAKEAEPHITPPEPKNPPDAALYGVLTLRVRMLQP